jgi:hypothetical protein
MQFKVPQDVERADKVLFGMTWTQIIILIIGGTLDYMIFAMLSKNFHFMVWIFPVAFFGFITLGMALIQIQSIPFYKFIVLLMEYLLLPRQRFWAPIHSPHTPLLFSGSSQVTPSPKTTKKKVSTETAEETSFKNIEDVTSALDAKETSSHDDMHPQVLDNLSDEHILTHSFVGPVDSGALQHLPSQK